MRDLFAIAKFLVRFCYIIFINSSRSLGTVGPHGWLSLNALWFWIDSAQSIFSNGSNTWLTGWRIVDVGCYGLKLWRIYSRSLSRKKTFLPTSTFSLSGIGRRFSQNPIDMRL